MSHITSCEIDHEHHVVDFVSHTWQFLLLFLVHIIRDRSCQLLSFMIYTKGLQFRDRSCQLLSFMTYTEGLQFFTLGSSISPQIYTASEVHAFLFEIDPDIIPRVTCHIMWDRSWTSYGWFRITYLAVPGIIFSAYHTVQFFRLQKINGKSRTAVYVDVRSCFRHLLRNNTRTRTPWCIADCLSFFLVTQSFSPHRWLVTFLKNFFSAGRVRVHTCCCLLYTSPSPRD